MSQTRCGIGSGHVRLMHTLAYAVLLLAKPLLLLESQNWGHIQKPPTLPYIICKHIITASHHFAEILFSCLPFSCSFSSDSGCVAGKGWCCRCSSGCGVAISPELQFTCVRECRLELSVQRESNVHCNVTITCKSRDKTLRPSLIPSPPVWERD